jgi:hypothetical protein
LARVRLSFEVMPKKRCPYHSDIPYLVMGRIPDGE